ncbi:MAG TPA: hypothetical protein VFS42_05855 [Burkholderiaceae bacterium]|nr:hypothetical protein [Burkholderiaceae bacterium]
MNSNADFRVASPDEHVRSTGREALEPSAPYVLEPEFDRFQLISEALHSAARLEHARSTAAHALPSEQVASTSRMDEARLRGQVEYAGANVTPELTPDDVLEAHWKAFAAVKTACLIDRNAHSSGFGPSTLLEHFKSQLARRLNAITESRRGTATSKSLLPAWRPTPAEVEMLTDRIKSSSLPIAMRLNSAERLAEAYQKLGQIDDAIATIGSALECNPREYFDWERS